MRNILDIDLTDEKCDGVYSSDCGSNCAQLIFNVKGLELTKPYLYFVLPDETIVQTGILDIENDTIGYEIPENILNKDGLISIILKAENNYESEAVYIEVVSYTEADTLICKYTSGKFIFSLYSNPEESDKVKVSPTKPISKDIDVWIKKSGNLLYTPYTVDNKLTHTSQYSDHYWHTGFRAYLQGGKTYSLSFETDAPEDGTISAFILFENEYSWYVGTNCKKFTFYPPYDGWYYLRLDNNTSGNTVSFWNFQIEEGSVTEWRQCEPKEIYVKNNSGTYEVFYSEKDLLKTQVYEGTFDNVGNSAATAPNVLFSTMFPTLNINDVICFNTEIKDVFTTWDRTYANVLMQENASGAKGTLQIRSYAATQTVSVRVTAFYR